jgi:predicted nucleic acid-binding protein
MILETSFLIDLLAGDPKARAKAVDLGARGETAYVPTPAVLELWAGVERSETSAREAAKVRNFLGSVEILPFEEADAREAGRFLGRKIREGKTPGAIDAEFAGMALARGETLLTADETLLSLAPEIRVERYR